MKTPAAPRLLSLVAIALIAAPFAPAQDSGWYLGANVGRSRSTVDNQRIATELWRGTWTNNTFSDRYSDTGFKLFGGYQMNKYFSMEAGYFDLGKFGFTASPVPSSTLYGDTKIQGVHFDGVFTLPMTEQFSAFVRVGVNHAESRDDFNGTGPVNLVETKSTRRDTNWKFGAGLQFDFTRTVGMRIEAERFRIKDAVSANGDINLISAGVLLRFGRTPPAPVQRAAVEAEPAPFVPPPYIQVAPVMVVVPVLAKTQQYCTILDIQFEVDQDEIQREEKEKLGVVATFLKKYPGTPAVIEGHTDNVGAVEHNQKLSQRRAESVVAYLVDNHQIEASRLTAVGYGDSRPIADNDSQDGKRRNRRIGALIACATDIEGLTVVPARMTLAMHIEYDRNNADVKPQYRDELRRVANFLTSHPKVTATVEGHTGNLQGTPAESQEISQRRAQNVVNALVDDFGVSRSRLTAEGFGKARRFAYNTSDEGKQENRRVNIIINYPPKAQSMLLSEAR
jgi:OOP family OmpA-OmpF porin